MSILSHHGLLLGAEGNPNWGNVVAQLNPSGTNGATSLADDTGLRSWAFNANAQIDTSVSANGVASILLDGTSDYLSTADVAAMRTDVSIFTIEIVARRNASKLQTLFGKRNTTSAEELVLYVAANNKLQFSAFAAGSPVITLTSTNTLSSSVFQHIEVGKNGSSWYLFLDGNLEASGTQSGAPTTNNQLFRIGRDGFDNSRDFNGWIGGFRRTNGVILHTASFTPPTMPFPT